MLNTYETIIGGPFLAEENFDSGVYTKLRNNSQFVLTRFLRFRFKFRVTKYIESNGRFLPKPKPKSQESGQHKLANSVLESCIDMARSSYISGLKIMLTNHWGDIEPHYLLVISSFPETTPPYNYRDFLPELTSDGQVLLWDERASKEKDWCDGFEMTDTTLTSSDILVVCLDQDHGEMHSAEYICHWYDCRVREIESLTGLINNALDMARLGVERNIHKLKTIMENLETLEILVYDLKLDDMTLEKLSEKLEILVSAAKEETFVSNFRMYALPFLDQSERREPGTKFALLNQYLAKISQKDLKLTLKVYVGALLRSGQSDIISLARNFLDQTPTEVETDEKGNLKVTRRNSSQYSTSFALYLYLIPYEESLGMILEATEIYFDSASNYADGDMELAKICLNLMQNSKEPNITLMFDLIDAVKVLNKDFNLHILPQSVRRSQDKIGLLRKAMENIEGGYKKIQQLLKLAMFLRVDEMNQEEVESCVFEMVGDSGLAEMDMKFCTQICHNIMVKSYHAGWKVFMQVAKFQSDPPILDHETRLAFINYALNVCPNDQIFHVLNAKYLIEIRSLQAQLTELSPNDSAIETAILESQEQESIVHEQLNKTKFEEFVQTTTTWINPLKKMAEVVKTGSGAILAVAKGQGHLHSHRYRHGSEPTLRGANVPEDEDEPNEKFFRESYPTFYISEDEASLVHSSLLASKYNTFSSATFATFIKSNPALELCLTINRIWHLERLLLGDEEAGERDEKVLEQLVGNILPEDIPWGLAILSSIDDTSVLSKILLSVPHTEISYKVILAYLAFRIHVELGIYRTEQDYAAWNLTKLVEDTATLVKNENKNKLQEKRIHGLIEIFQQFKENMAIPSIQDHKHDVAGPDEEVDDKDNESYDDFDDFQDGDGWES